MMYSLSVRAVALMFVMGALLVSGLFVTEADAVEPLDPDKSIVINEIMYTPEGIDAEVEWIEVYNRGLNPVNMTDWWLCENGANQPITLHNGSINVPPGGYAVIANNGTAFLENHTGFSGFVLNSTFDLADQGEFLALRNGSAGPMLDKVDYSSAWGGDEAYSLECRNATLDNNASLNWGTSKVYNGTPGALNSIMGSLIEITGDWQVDYGEVVDCENLTVILTGNLYVGGRLNLINTTLIMNTTVNGTNFIDVNATGHMEILDYDGDPATTGAMSVITAATLDWQNQL